MKNKIILSLIFVDFVDWSHDELAIMMGLTPSYKMVKGEKKNKTNPASPLYKINKLAFDSGLGSHADFDKQMDALLDMIESKREIIRKIGEKCYCLISCGIFVYYDIDESTPWIYLGERYNKLAADLKLSFDMDLHVRSSE